MDEMLFHETQLQKQGFSSIAGIDEAGRGPLAGPVVAAACILPLGISFPEINDSKQLSASARERIYLQLLKNPQVSFGIGLASVEEIDKLNILQATFLAMKRAVYALPKMADHLLIDGNLAPKLNIPIRTIVQGDSLSVSIAAASILAKVYRDHLMELLGKVWPQYLFEKHKGYGTLVHRNALQKWGICPIHRRSFAPCREQIVV
jgi:ribonuclease HII